MQLLLLPLVALISEKKMRNQFAQNEISNYPDTLYQLKVSVLFVPENTGHKISCYNQPS
jgi:hypothetical protein